MLGKQNVLLSKIRPFLKMHDLDDLLSFSNTEIKASSLPSSQWKSKKFKHTYYSASVKIFTASRVHHCYICCWLVKKKNLISPLGIPQMWSSQKPKFLRNAELRSTKQERKVKYASGVGTYILESIRLLWARKTSSDTEEKTARETDA